VTRDSTRAHLSKEVRSGAVGHVAAPDLTSTGRCGLKLQLAWQRVDARHAPYLDLELVCGANFSTPRSIILIFLLCSRRRVHHPRENVDDGPREVPELKVRQRPPST
jgi:hypothetical protein